MKVSQWDSMVQPSSQYYLHLQVTAVTCQNVLCEKGLAQPEVSDMTWDCKYNPHSLTEHMLLNSHSDSAWNMSDIQWMTCRWELPETQTCKLNRSKSQLQRKSCRVWYYSDLYFLFHREVKGQVSHRVTAWSWSGLNNTSAQVQVRHVALKHITVIWLHCLINYNYLKENFGRFNHAASLLKLPLTCQYRRCEHIWSNHYRALWTRVSIDS